MVIVIASIALAIAISLFWYMPGIRAQGKSRVLTNGNYAKIALLYGLLFSCGLIIVTEILWDFAIYDLIPAGLGREIIVCFFRAALLEELFKTTGFILAKNDIGLTRKIDYIMSAGLIGLVYGVVEKTVLGSISAVIVGLFLPLHIFWQFNQGAHFYEYDKAKKEGNKEKARKELFMALFVPFFLHGCWDSVLEIIGTLVEMETSVASVVSAIGLMIVTLVCVVIYTVKTMKMVRGTAIASRMVAEEGK